MESIDFVNGPQFKGHLLYMQITLASFNNYNGL